jgi:hypothetical protein
MIKAMLKDPRVETTSTIRSFQEKNNYSTVNSLIIKADTSNAVQKLFLGMTVGYFIFDKDGNQICYNGSETCHGSQFKQLINGRLDSFMSCENAGVHLSDVLAETYNLDEKPVDRSHFPVSEYYVVSYWQKFLGGKKGYEDAVSWMEEEIRNSPSGSRFTFIKINTDLQDKWGFVAGKKAKLRWKRKGDQMTMTVTDLPVRK